MTLKFAYLEEPVLRFGDYFEHQDAKTGLAEYGSYGTCVPGLHPQEIKLGFIGTGDTISSAKEWIERCSGHIESENIKLIKSKLAEDKSQMVAPFVNLDAPEIRRLDKIQNRDFPGFNKENSFKCSFVLNQRWEKTLNYRELQAVLEIVDKRERIEKLVEMIDSCLSSIVRTPPIPDIIMIAITEEMEELAHSYKISGNFHLNLRRCIKARAMNQPTPIPVQIITQRALKGKGDVQEPALRAWNFCTAQYYKANGTPWIAPTLEPDTCYVGVSFYVVKEINDELTIRSSVSQAFDYLGQGLILRGDPFEWDKKSGRVPHLTKSGASILIRQTLTEYYTTTGQTPKRVVIHKSSLFWGAERGEFDEIDGFYEGIDAVAPRCETDFVTLKQTGLRLFREGKYPPLRGTYFCVEGREHFLYTMGFVPYLETYPRTYVPEPWQIVQHIGGSSPKELCREILTLTKMYVNNCDFADGSPITISFSEKVGEIMKHVSDGEKIQSSYRFYM
ncbi:MAG: hypothetical protein ABSF90_29135 [Syntrophobacteraceae bacterium]|jgi:hypothetical protein